MIDVKKIVRDARFPKDSKYVHWLENPSDIARRACIATLRAVVKRLEEIPCPYKRPFALDYRCGWDELCNTAREELEQIALSAEKGGGG